MDKLALALLVTFLAATLYPFGSCAPTPGHDEIPDDSQGDSSPASESKSGGDKADSNPLDVRDEERGHSDKPPDDSQDDSLPVSQDSSITGNLEEPASESKSGGDKTDQNPFDVGDEGIGHPDKPSDNDDELDVSSHMKGDTGMDEGDNDSQPGEQEKKAPENPNASQKKKEEVLDVGNPDTDQSENEHNTDSESHPDSSDGLDSVKDSENTITDSEDPDGPNDVGDAGQKDLSDENKDDSASEVNPETHEDDVENDELDGNPSTENPDLGKKQDAGDEEGETKNPGHEIKEEAQEETSETDTSDQNTDANPKNPNNELKNPKGKDSKEDQEEVGDEGNIDQDVDAHSQNLGDKLNNPKDAGKDKSESLVNGNTAIPNQDADENPLTSDEDEAEENPEDHDSQDEDAGGEKSPTEQSIAPEAGNENEDTETRVVPKSTLETKAAPSISPTPDKSLTEKENLSTGKSAITTRSTTENKQEIPSEMTSQASNFPTTFYNTRPTFPNMNRPPWSSMAPAGYRPTTYSQYPYFYYNGQSSYPIPTSPFNANYDTNRSKSPQQTTAEQKIEPSASATESEITTPENATESTVTPQVTNPSSTPEPEIIPETTTGVQESTPSPTSIVITSTEEPTTAQETLSQTTQHSLVILPGVEQTEASPVLESTSKVTETPSEATEGNDNVHHNRKRPPVHPGEGREGGSSIPKKEEEKEEHKSTSTTTSTTTEVSYDSTSTGDLVSEDTDWMRRFQEYGKDLVKQMGALKVSLILLAVLALSILSVCCCCKICKKKGYRMRQRRLKEFGQEKEFLLRDRNKSSKYNNDTVTLLEGSSEDEF